MSRSPLMIAYVYVYGVFVSPPPPPLLLRSIGAASKRPNPSCSSASARGTRPPQRNLEYTMATPLHLVTRLTTAAILGAYAATEALDRNGGTPWRYSTWTGLDDPTRWKARSNAERSVGPSGTLPPADGNTTLQVCIPACNTPDRAPEAPPSSPSSSRSSDAFDAFDAFDALEAAAAARAASSGERSTSRMRPSIPRYEGRWLRPIGEPMISYDPNVDRRRSAGGIVSPRMSTVGTRRRTSGSRPSEGSIWDGKL